jgi:alkylglycerol monooxygenase
METYGKILLIMMPVFFILILFEKWYGWRKGKDTVATMDTVASLTSGITNVTKDVLGLSISILSYKWLVGHLAITHVENTFIVYLICFLTLDFAGYWSHRIKHRVNVFWNAHTVHHSSEEFNLACALRQSISVFVEIFTFFLLPAAILGVPVEVVAIIAPLHLFMQFWYHTQHIGSLGWLEHIIVTPAHHRVHHAMNPEYIDKNYSQILIIWDKIFGTFQEEMKDKPPVYGITRPSSTWNPIRINFQHLVLLIQDAWRTSSWEDKVRIWFMPTGWRPGDVEEKYPVPKIHDVYHFEKYQPTSSKALEVWSIVQLLMVLLYLTFLLSHLAQIGSPGIFLYGAFIFMAIYAMTELMDGNRFAPFWEVLKSAFAFYLIMQQGGWFGAEKYHIAIPAIIGAFQVVGIVLSIYFTRIERNFAIG